MQALFIGIFIFYLIITALEYGLDYLNLKHVKEYGGIIPKPFEGFIDQELLIQTANYLFEKSKASLVSSIIGQLLLIWFLFGGLLNVYNNWIVSLQLGTIWSGVVFFLFLVYAQMLIGIPVSLYQTFVIEKKYGFNTTTKKIWLFDLIKSLIISTILLGIAVSAALWLIKLFPTIWWLVVWGFFLAFGLLLTFISPYVLEPLFNKYTPLEEGDLTSLLKEVSQKAGVKVSRVFTMDASKRSKHTNAYFTGIGKVKRIVLFDTLIEKMGSNEIIAVLAHELGHWKKKHILKRFVMSELLALAGFYIAFIVLQSDFLSLVFHLDNDTFLAKLILLGLLSGLVMFPFTPLLNAYSRKHEREADDFAFSLTGTSDGMISALVKLSKDNLSNLHPHPWYAAFHYSHPPVVERIKRLKAMS